MSNILVIDDRVENLHLLTRALDAHGYEVRKAVSGALAIRAVQMRPPDLILLDVMMPDLDGYEVCRQLKGDDLTKDIPVIFLSACDDPQGKVQAFQVGGSDYITKPFNIEELIARVEWQLKISHHHHQLRQQNQKLQEEVCKNLSTQFVLESLTRQLHQNPPWSEQTEDQQHSLATLQSELDLALSREATLRKAQSHLLDTISHEFRTPLSIISMATRLLQSDHSRQNTQLASRYFEQITTSVQRINHILEDSLLLLQLDAGEVTIKPQWVDRTILCQILQTTYVLPDTHSLQLLGEHELPDRLWLDCHLLKLMLNRLLMNAARYSPRGGVIGIEVSYQQETLQVKVSDCGIGIPKAEQEQIFERFYRASNADRIQGTPGAGLGLAVVRRLMALYGGQIGVTSHLDRGTTFTLNLPSTHFTS